MLTIGQLADYVGVTQRAVRHYHAIGLLPEPARTSSGYRSYTAQDVVDLQRIKVLTDAGVPLARVRELVAADPATLRAAVAEIDADLRRRVRQLQHTRRSLAELATGADAFLPPEVAVVLERMRDLGVSDRTLALNRDAWLLIRVLYPHLVESWLAAQSTMLDDSEYRDVYVLTDQAFDWAPDDPRIDELARRTAAWALSRPQPDSTGWDADATAYQLVSGYQLDASPGWRRLMQRIAEIIHEQDELGQ